MGQIWETLEARFFIIIIIYFFISNLQTFLSYTIALSNSIQDFFHAY